MSDAGIFGPIVATMDIEEAVLSTLRVWMPEWLAAVERSRGLERGFLTRSLAPSSYHGGDDFDSWKSDLLPEYIVWVKPESLERDSSSASYTIAYEIQVAVIVERQDEEDARLHTSLHAAALMFLVQQGALGGIAERTVMTAAPGPELLATNERRFGRAIGKFTTYVVNAVNEFDGPAQPNPKESPQYKEKEGEWNPEPTVVVTVETIRAGTAWAKGNEYMVGQVVEELGIFYEAVKLQKASEPHKPSADSTHTYWKVLNQ